ERSVPEAADLHAVEDELRVLVVAREPREHPARPLGGVAVAQDHDRVRLDAGRVEASAGAEVERAREAGEELGATVGVLGLEPTARGLEAGLVGGDEGAAPALGAAVEERHAEARLGPEARGEGQELLRRLLV